MNYFSEVTESLMVIVTSLYLAATIVMCVFNGIAARAAKDQTQELKNQFYAVNRPVLVVDIVQRPGKNLLALRLKNEGNQTAMKTEIKIDESFVSSLPEERFREHIAKELKKTRTVGVGQSYDLFFGSDEYITAERKDPIIGQIVYQGVNGMAYTDDFEIDVESYLAFCV